MHLNRLISVGLFLKNMLTIKIYLQISAYYVYPVNPFQADVTFLYSLRKPEIFILDVFRAYRNGTSASNGLR